MTTVVFMGTPEFAVPTLRALAAQYAVAGVVTQPDRPAGRGRQMAPPPVKLVALEHGLPIVQPEKLRAPEAMDQLRAWAPEVIVVAAFGQILRPAVLDLPPHGCINVHASLLPRHRGAAPIAAAILHGDSETGVTIMRMDPGVDTGPMIAARAISLLPDDTPPALGARLARLGADLLMEVLPEYLTGRLSPRPQDDAGATYAPQLRKEDGRLDFRRPAAELEHRVRACTPWPGAFAMWQGAPLKVLRAQVVAGGAGLPGQVSEDAHGPVVACGEGGLQLLEVQAPGRRPLPGVEFSRGAHGFMGARLA